MKAHLTICVAVAFITPIQSSAQQQPGNTVPVTVDTFVRAETDLYFWRSCPEGRRLRQVRAPP